MESREAVVNVYDLDFDRVNEIRERGKPLTKDELREMKPSKSYSAEEYFLKALPREREATNIMVNPNIPVVDLDFEFERGEEICVPFRTTIKFEDRPGGGFEIVTCVVEACFRPFRNP